VPCLLTVLYALSPENPENLRGRDIALHSSDMITIGGEQHRTIADAARDWSVSTKTVRDWIERTVIPKPPKVRHGLRTIQVFPANYMAKAVKAVEDWNRRREAG